MKARPWTSEEDLRLRDLVAAGLDDQVLALTLERTARAVKQRRAAYGLCLVRPGAWTAERDDRLRTLMNGGSSLSAAAREMSVSVDVIKYRRRILGLVRVPRIPPALAAEACELIEEGLTPTQVSRRLGVSSGWVEYYARRDGAVSAKSLSSGDVRRLDADLVSLATEGHSYVGIGRRLGIADNVVRCRLGRSPGAIQTALSHAGMLRRVSSIPATYRDSMREKAGLGWRTSRIALATGYDVDTVQRVIAAYGPLAPVRYIEVRKPAPEPEPVVDVAPEPAPPPPPPVDPLAFPPGHPIPARAKRVIRRIATATGVPVVAILGRSRAVAIVPARQAACYMLRRLGLSAPVVGRILQRDHTTVLYASEQYIRRRAALGRRLPPIVAATAEPIR